MPVDGDAFTGSDAMEDELEVLVGRPEVGVNGHKLASLQQNTVK